MSRIPPALARRIDRTGRRAHAFHRLAHHPLCLAYAPEVIVVGRRTRLCRGCALAAAGAAMGLAAGLVAPALPAPLLLSALAVFAAVALDSARRPAAGRRRRSKLVSRLLPMALGGAVLSAGLASRSLAGLAAAAGVAAAAAGATLVYRRRGPDRAACLACPERVLASSCAGYRPMARRERAFRRLAGRWIAAEVVPGHLARSPGP